MNKKTEAMRLDELEKSRQKLEESITQLSQLLDIANKLMDSIKTGINELPPASDDLRRSRSTPSKKETNKKEVVIH